VSVFVPSGCGLEPLLSAGFEDFSLQVFFPVGLKIAGFDGEKRKNPQILVTKAAPGHSLKAE